ncbi:MAG: bifunctional diguanylate cyclase/phosphodiesterase [Pseudomonadota bacterium]
MSFIGTTTLRTILGAGFGFFLSQSAVAQSSVGAQSGSVDPEAALALGQWLVLGALILGAVVMVVIAFARRGFAAGVAPTAAAFLVFSAFFTAISFGVFSAFPERDLTSLAKGLLGGAALIHIGVAIPAARANMIWGGVLTAGAIIAGVLGVAHFAGFIDWPGAMNFVLIGAAFIALLICIAEAFAGDIHARLTLPGVMFAAGGLGFFSWANATGAAGWMIDLAPFLLFAAGALTATFAAFAAGPPASRPHGPSRPEPRHEPAAAIPAAAMAEAQTFQTQPEPQFQPEPVADQADVPADIKADIDKAPLEPPVEPLAEPDLISNAPVEPADEARVSSRRDDEAVNDAADAGRAAQPLHVVSVSQLEGAEEALTMSDDETNPQENAPPAEGLALAAAAATAAGGASASKDKPVENGDAQLAAILDYSGIGVWDWNGEADLVNAAPAAATLFGFDADVPPKSADRWRQRVLAEDVDAFDAAIGRTPRSVDGDFDLEFAVAAPNGLRRRLRMRGARAVSASGGPERVVAFVEEAAVQRPAALGAPSMSATAANAPSPKPADAKDALTGLASRAGALAVLGNAIASAPSGAAALVIDLDKFKAVNAALGHDGGDTLLKILAGRIAGALRPGETAARLSGDEFAVVVEGEAEDLQARADAILALIEQPLQIDGREVFPAASIGVAMSSGPGQSAEALLNAAETATKAAKSEGRGRVVLYSRGDHGDPAEDMGMGADLNRALERGELELRYQPIIRLADGTPAGFEALIRWRHPEKGLLSPDEFIPMADEMSVINTIGRAVLFHAAEDLARWRAATGLDKLFMAVNISSRQLLTSGFENDVAEAVKAAALPAGALHVELTESQIMARPDEAANVLQRLKDAGAGLALDDFGTGYSSLSHLQRFDFDCLKIDKSFVAAMDHDPVSVKIARSIIELGHDLAMTVVAEGVETELSARRLRAMGCEFAQGYIFGAPMEGEEAYALLAQSVPGQPSSLAGE